MTTLRLNNSVQDVQISAVMYGMIQHIEAAVLKVQKVLATWASRSKDRRQLSVMSDRMLTDIGLTRADIAIEIDKYFWQR